MVRSEGLGPVAWDSLYASCVPQAVGLRSLAVCITAAASADCCHRHRRSFMHGSLALGRASRVRLKGAGIWLQHNASSSVLRLIFRVRGCRTAAAGLPCCKAHHTPDDSELLMPGSLTAEDITPPLDAAIAACQDELDAKQAPVAGFLAVRLTVSGDDGAVSDLQARCVPCARPAARGTADAHAHFHDISAAHRIDGSHEVAASRDAPLRSTMDFVPSGVSAAVSPMGGEAAVAGLRQPVGCAVGGGHAGGRAWHRNGL